MSKLTNARRAELSEKAVEDMMEREGLNNWVKFTYCETIKSTTKKYINKKERERIWDESIEEERWLAMDLIREGW